MLAGFAVGTHLVRTGRIVPPVCGFRTLWGIPCPGCGGTRATLAFFEGDFLRALHFHPFVAGVLAWWAIVLVRWAVERSRGRHLVLRTEHLDAHIGFMLGFASVFAIWGTILLLAPTWPVSGG